MYSYYYNHLAHWCGSELQKIAKKNPASLNQEEKERLNDPTLREMARKVLDEIGHYFVGPAAGTKDRFPRHEDEEARGVLEDNTYQVQRAKFAAFANIDPNISPEDLCGILGLAIDK